MRNDLRDTIGVLLAVLVVTGCAQSGDEPERTSNSVFVSIVPLEFFAQTVGGSRVRVQSLVGPGQSPATYEPTAKQLTALADSKIFFTVGVPVETQLIPRVRSGFPGVEIVNVLEGVPIEGARAERTGDEGPDGSGDHHEFDPHVWLSPPLAKMIARNMTDALSRIDPERAAEYLQNYERLARDLDSLDAEIKRILAPIRGEELVVFHPAYGYFAAEYGLRQVAIESGGVAPGSQRLTRLIEHARARHVKAIFVQPQFSSTAAETVAETIGAKVIQLDPLARDYIENLREMAITIRSVYTNG
jgi:zinc transport system substrate-binding protein